MYADSGAMKCANTVAEASGAGRTERLIILLLSTAPFI
jgi:hypothetical protein